MRWAGPLSHSCAFRVQLRRSGTLYQCMVAKMSTQAKPDGATAGTKLHGRAFYESIGSPKYIVAPMVDQSEFAWRMLSRSFLTPEENSKVLAYTPMLHARLFAQDEKYRKAHLQAVRPDSDEPWLDGNPNIDRPLFVQFCANDPTFLLEAARQAAPYCDAVDLNLGCPQGIARKGHYGAFLQEDQDLIFRLINTLHKELPIPVTAKIRVLETKEKTLAYAQNVLKAGASILTVHGRLREQKGHLTGIADWKMIKFLRENLPAETVLFANGNILQQADLQRCLDSTGADGVMSAEGNLSDPAIFAQPPPEGKEGKEYWRGRDGRGGYRVDAVMRRYLDILHKYSLSGQVPERRPLFMPGDDVSWMTKADTEAESAGKEVKRSNESRTDPNITAMQPHLFHVLRHFVSKHTDIRDQLAKARRFGIDGFERVLDAVEKRVAEGLLEYEKTEGQSFQEELKVLEDRGDEGPEEESSLGAIKRCKRPWWVVQPIIRPMPKEALAKGAVSISKKKRKLIEASADSTEGESTKVAKTADTKESEEKKEEIESRDALLAG